MKFAGHIFLLWVAIEAYAAPKVVIIGGGLTGLSTAYHLKKQGYDYQILELHAQVGGRVQTAQYDIPGYPPVTADSGMEEYWESNPGVKILRELELPIREDYSVSSIVLLGKLYPATADDAEGFLRSVFTSEERKALDAFLKKSQGLYKKIRDHLSLKDTAFSEWVEAQKLPKKVSEWVRVSIECEIGTSWDEISAVDGIAEMHIFYGEGEKGVRVLGGNEQFIQKLAQNVGRENILTHRKVTRLLTKGEKVHVHAFNLVSHKAEVYEADHAVTTMPIFRLPMEIQKEPPLSRLKLESISSLGWGNYFKAHVIVKPGQEKLWSISGKSILPLLSDSELGVIYDGNPDQPDGPRVLSLLIFGAHADAFNMMPQDMTRVKIQAALEKRFPGIGKSILDIHFFRYHPRAIASWPVGRSRFDELSQALRMPEGRVYFAGDFTESSHSDGAFISAERVVSQILKADVKPEQERMGYGK